MILLDICIKSQNRYVIFFWRPKATNSQENMGGRKMKKEFIWLMLIAILIFVFPMFAYADDVSDELAIITISDSDDFPVLNGLRERGTFPNYILAGENLFQIQTFGWSNSGEFSGPTARIMFEATEDFDGTGGWGTNIRFWTTDVGRTNIRERMRIEPNGNVGIGTSSPETNLEVTSRRDESVRIYATTYNDSSGTGSIISGRRARGTRSNPSAVQEDDRLLSLSSRGYGDGDDDFGGPTAYINLVATENFTNTEKGTAISFATTTNGTTDRDERMRIDNNGNVGIGTINPSSILEVVTEDSMPRIIATSYHTQLSGDHAGGGAFTGRLVRGTSDEPSAVQIDDTIAAFTGQGYNGVGIGGRSKGGMFIRAEENWTPGAEGTRIVFVTTPTGSSSPAERLRISSEGNVGIGTETPQSALQVDGYVQLALTDGNMPPEADCDESSEYGRMMVDQINEDVYICVVSGWKTLKGKK